MVFHRVLSPEVKRDQIDVEGQLDIAQRPEFHEKLVTGGTKNCTIDLRDTVLPFLGVIILRMEVC